MIQISLELYRDRCLRQILVQGHASGEKAGYNVPCAAVTALVRTAACTLGSAEGLSLEVQADNPGFLQIVLGPVMQEKRDWVRGITEYLTYGLLDVVSEYPEDVRIDLHDYNEE